MWLLSQEEASTVDDAQESFPNVCWWQAGSLEPCPVSSKYLWSTVKLSLECHLGLPDAVGSDEKFVGIKNSICTDPFLEILRPELYFDIRCYSLFGQRFWHCLWHVCILSNFEGTENVHCYLSCAMTDTVAKYKFQCSKR